MYVCTGTRLLAESTNQDGWVSSYILEHRRRRRCSTFHTSHPPLRHWPSWRDAGQTLSPLWWWCRRRRAAASGWNAARNFSARGDRRGGREVVPGGLALSSRPHTSAESKARNGQRLWPWLWRPDLALAERSRCDLVGYVGAVGQLAEFSGPVEQKVRIYRRTRQATTSSSDKTKAPENRV